MPLDHMLTCERRTRYKVAGEVEIRWKDVPASDVVGAASGDIRCAHCHGPVRVHRQRVEHGPQDHAEHRRRQDSEGCRAGHYFTGQPRMSSTPVEQAWGSTDLRRRPRGLAPALDRGDNGADVRDKWYADNRDIVIG